MDPQFWIKAWKEGRTNFHQDHYHSKLVEYLPTMALKKGQRVLVPLCGKTKDLIWLHGLGLRVRGVELYDEAVRAFFGENGYPRPQITQDETYTHYAHDDIVVSCGDFFKLNENDAYDLIYDRGALVALPPPMRRAYAEVIKRAVKVGGGYLLIVYQYDASQMQGPPFAVDDDEIHGLYEDRFDIRLMESKRPDNEGARLAAVESLRQNVYILKRRS